MSEPGACGGEPTRAVRVRYLDREAVTLSNDRIVTTIDALGAMAPVFGARRRGAVLNAHWIPDFRTSPPLPWSEERHHAYFGAKILSLLAGEFPCSPNFGDPCEVEGVAIPAHGWTATEKWDLEEVGIDAITGAAYLRSSLHSPSGRLPLSWEKLDLILPGEPVHYSALRIHNHGDDEVSVNLVRHNTVGPPFLAPGCRFSCSANHFLVAPPGSEFDATGRLLPGGEFEGLDRAPLRNGATVDLRQVPGMIGATDFITGAVPSDAKSGWSCVLNPRELLAYLSFFPGPEGLAEQEISLAFNNLWMQFGGRPFPPWALHEGGPDRTYCLGPENGTAYFGKGLAESRTRRTLMGRDTVVVVPGRGARTLWYAIALLAVDAALAAEGIEAVESERDHLLLRGRRSVQCCHVSADFAIPRALGARVLCVGSRDPG